MQTGGPPQILERVSSVLHRLTRDGQHLIYLVAARLHLWNVVNQKPVFDVLAHGGSTHALVWNPEETLIATGGDNREIKLWDIQTGQLARTLTGHLKSKSISALAFSPDGQLLLLRNTSQEFRLFRMPRGTALR